MSMVIAGLLFASGLIITFASGRVRRRIVGVAVMGVGALVALGTASPESGVPWWLMGVAATTLGAMIALAAWLARRLDDEPDAATSLDEDRP